MICVAISDKDPDKCLATLSRVELAEIRIDLTEFGPDEVRRVCSHLTPTVATCRADRMSSDKQLELLSLAISSGAKYVDIEIEAGKNQIRKIIRIARQHNCRVIISYHNYRETPPTGKLGKIIRKCYSLGADVAKVATLAKSKADSIRILSLYGNAKPLIALGMGEAGMITRIIAPLLGAEFTFASADDGTETALGQIKYSEMKKILDEIGEKIQTEPGLNKIIR